MKVDLKANPFNLTEKQEQTALNLVKSLSTEEKIGQLFCLLGDFKDEEEIKEVVTTYKPGGVMYRPQDSEIIQKRHFFLQKYSKIPLLLAANLESGGDGIGLDGTFFGRQIQVAATNDNNQAYRLGKIAALEGKAVGCNWAFAPVVDYNYNFANPIINVRTYGDDPERVISMASQYMKACQEEDVAVSIKHFPGDGVDDRDQHLLTSVNSLSIEEWDKSYGKIYKTLIDRGALTLMAGHIAMPAYSKFFNPNLKDEEILPGSLSKELLQDLLRGKLGFNGLISTDATNMVGFANCGQRKDLLPKAINAGCDMILFTHNLQEDYKYVVDAVETGVISVERLDDAVTRIIGTKMALNLFDKQRAGTLVPGPKALSVLQCKQHEDWARELSEKSITLVKDTQNILPISPKKYHNILVFVLGDVVSASGKPPVHTLFDKALEDVGFNVSVFDTDNNEMKQMMISGSIEKFKNKYDLVIYFANIKTASNQTTVRINWSKPMGYDVPWFINEIPTIFVSVANPYHLQDVPMVKTYINAYTANKYNPKIIVEKLVGKSKFEGISPVDPFCGYWNTKF